MTHIPLYPRGRPLAKDLRADVEELFVLCDVDIYRAIELPLTAGELITRPSDEKLFERFISHASRSIRIVRQPMMYVVPWRIQPFDLLRLMIALSERLPMVPTGKDSKHVLFFEGHAEAHHFTSTEPQGRVSLYHDGVWKTDVGQFFLVCGHALMPKTDRAACLRAFLLPKPKEDDEDSFPPSYRRSVRFVPPGSHEPMEKSPISKRITEPAPPLPDQMPFHLPFPKRRP